MLQRFSDCGLTFKREKCEFNKSEVKFFGYIFDKHGMRPDPEKVQALKDTEAPKTVEEMRSFLGMSNFCSHFIPNYSILTGPLRAMTRKGTTFAWSEESRAAFKKVKEALLAETTLAYFDPNRPTRLYVDGSKTDGVGSILAQLDEKSGKYRPIRYDSRALNDPETRYSQIDAESLAIYTGIMKCHIYLYGLQSFEVVTDHQPLLALYNKFKQTIPPRVQHHKIMTQGYAYTVRYERGQLNPSDYLSRHPSAGTMENDEAQEQWDIEIDTLIEWAVPNAVTLEQIQESTRKSPEMSELKIAIRRGYVEKSQHCLQPYKKIHDEMTVEKDIVLRGERIVMPEDLQKRIIQIAHESHLGESRQFSSSRKRCGFPIWTRRSTTSWTTV